MTKKVIKLGSKMKVIDLKPKAFRESYPLLNTFLLKGTGSPDREEDSYEFACENSGASEERFVLAEEQLAWSASQSGMEPQTFAKHMGMLAEDGHDMHCPMEDGTKVLMEAYKILEECY